MKRWCALFIIVLLLASGTAAAPVSADDTYNYSYWGTPVPAPDPYSLEQVISGSDWSQDALSSPQDMYAGQDGRLYIADTGNSRIVILNRDLQLEKVIGEFEHDGKKDSLNHPQGIFVDSDQHIYVADTDNRRIVEFDQNGKPIRVMNEPKSTLLREGFQYQPVKLVVDKAKRLYVISQGCYEGIMEFDSDGGFNGFIGTNRIKFSPVDLFWKRISTKAQREQMQQFIPIEFNNLDVDDNGFIYTSSSEENSEQPLKRLNPSGTDILRSKGYFPPKGDVGNLEGGSLPGSSIFVDIISDQGGMYSALDSKRGRIFTYDKDGNLLYEFGGLGSQQGNFRTPVAIEMLGERMLVLDKDNNRLSVFNPTPYGDLIRSAVAALSEGKSEQSTSDWRKVLQLNANFDVAYIGIGKSLLKQGDNREAMNYFKLGNSREYYSEAFKRYRKEVVFEHFGMIVLFIVLAVAVIIAGVKLANRKTKGQFYREFGIIRNPFYTLLHPFNGFWEMKYERKGRLSVAFVIMALLVIATIVKRQFNGFVINFNNPEQLNSLDELKFIVLPFLLWCVANWSLTTLMDGEGKFTEIMIATAYSLLPLVLIYFPQMLYSNVITADESSFYYLLNTIAMIWFVWLLFTGTMTVHQYSAGKTIVTMLLTLVVMGIIIFLGVLFFSMLQQMINFVSSIYKEISFRM
ncbi:YIP1 family protein [Paenibacillus dokdonensis]|uniref:YIP1 family protein n=1 Tax=Paenibacillus dokdonensis TaxID=2567944 RepID=A0ABU6GH03_9BACL|nr:YIP1 family protein [Paenibacillus dokdonensis]MEC0238998.1 YIP1 family protein [Paenibacillus dokdonensis]